MFTMRNLISRAFFTLQDTKTPLILGAVTVAINVVLNLTSRRPARTGRSRFGYGYCNYAGVRPWTKRVPAKEAWQAIVDAIACVDH